VGSWVYVFGVVTIAALVLTVLSGVILAIAGPDWWHISAAGRFFNSLHFWSVQVFFVFMVLHLWGQYFMASWRGGRAVTWMVGVVIFAISIGAAFTGYLSQQNFASQWIAVSAKDALNASGLGAFFNVLNFGQMYGIHVLLLPAAIIVLVALHIVWVRMKGVVRPIESSQRATRSTSEKV
jgi:quinol-cytochrome oxidoreductase complex cytochrome b subunit